MNGLRFSVIITSHNQRDLLADAVGSALALRHSNFEVIVVDDGSTDDSQDFVRTYGNSIRFVPLSQNRGRGSARNCAAEVARGEYLVFLDGDDVLVPWALDVYETVAAARSPAIILAMMRWFDGPAGTVLRLSAPRQVQYVEYADYLCKDRSFGASASSIIVKREAFEAVSGWSNLDVLEDQELLLRLCTSGPAVQLLSSPTVGHRKHPAQSIHRVPPFLGALAEVIRKERAGGFPGGRSRRRDRQAVIGALAYYWCKRAYRDGLYQDAAYLGAETGPMQLLAAIRRLKTLVLGRQRVRTLAISL